MLSFDISAIDVVLLLAVMVLFILFITQKRNQSVVKPPSNIDAQEKPSRKSEKIDTATEESVEKQSIEGFQKCVHEFGYLRGMSKNTPIPDECFGCPKVMRCLFPSPHAAHAE